MLQFIRYDFEGDTPPLFHPKITSLCAVSADGKVGYFIATILTNTAKDMTRQKGKIQSITDSDDWPT